MSLTFYYAPMSTASVTTLVLEELQIPHEKVKLDLRAGDAKKPDFLKINPNGKVPTIVHDGTAIWESVAITMYLGETFGVEKGLYPAPGPKRAQAQMWLVWAHVTLGEAVYRWARNTMWAPPDQQNEKAAAAAKGDIASLLGVLDGGLEGREYLTGSFTLADAHVSSFIEWLRQMKIDFTPFARLNAWSERCSKRPAVARAMKLE